MQNKEVIKEALNFLEKQQFVNIASSNKKSEPHASLKLVLKAQEPYVYLIDFLVGSTARNLEENPKICISTFDLEKVLGYYFYADIQIIDMDADDEFKKLIKEFEQRQIQIASRKVAKDVSKEKKTPGLKLTFLKPVLIYKARIHQVRKVDSRGLLTAQNED